MKTISLLLLLLLSGAVYAAETDALFSGADGKLVLPYLRIGNEVYYLELNLVDPQNLLFQVSLSSIVNITPSGGVTQDSSAILGTWSTSSYSLTLNENGTYLYITISSDSGCPLGEESGIFQFEPSTGVLVTTPQQDANGACGFSGSTGIKRISVDGNQFQLSLGAITTTLNRGNPDTGNGDGTLWGLTIAKSGSGNGTVSSSQQPGINCGSTCLFNFLDQTFVTLTATPDNGSYFAEWGGCDVVKGPGGITCDITVVSNKTISVQFVSTLLTASTNGTGAGSIVSTPSGINCGTTGNVCAFAFPVNSTISLQATPSPTSIFQSWSGNCASTSGPGGSICNVAITAGQSANLQAVATFIAAPVVTVGLVGSGSGSVTSSNPGISCGTAGTACSFAFAAGTTVSLTAQAANGSTFQGWSGGCTSITGTNGSICNVLINANQSNNVTVDAAFTRNP